MRLVERHDIVRASFVPVRILLLALMGGCTASFPIASDVGGGSPGTGGMSGTGGSSGTGGAAGAGGMGGAAGMGGTGGTLVCQPGTMAPCYSGPPGTEGVGQCTAGTHTCNPDGMTYGPCIGEILPAAEICGAAMQDENCDGDPACACGDGTLDAGSTLCEAGAWPFSEGSGGTTADATGNANDGTLSNTAWIAGHSGNGLQFFGSGSPSSVLIPYNAPLKFGTGDFTVVAWVARLGAWGINEAIVVGANRCGVKEAWLLSMLGMSSSSSFPGFATFGPGSTGGYLVSPTAIADTNWHQLAGRRSGTTVTLLVDGVVKATGTVSSSYSSDAGGAGMMVGNLQDGIQDPSCPAGREFNGKIDSIYLFNRALTDADIALLQ